MSKKANPAVIGGFVVGAIALVVAGLMLFGSGRLFADIEYFVMFFERSSLKGLNIGAPVTFRGIQVGSVTDILVYSNPEKVEFRIPVFVEIDANRFKHFGEKEREYVPRGSARAREVINRLIENGLRAQLRLQSLVTGLLFIDLDLHPESPAILHGTEHLGISEKYYEIPTMLSTVQALQKTLEELPLKELVEDIQEAADGVNNLVNSPELAESVHELKETLVAFKTLAQDVNRQVEPLADSMQGTMTAFKKTAGDAHKLVRNIDSQMDPVAAEFQKTSEAVQHALKQAEKTLATIEEVASEGTALRYDLQRALAELAGAARSIRTLADYLEQHPDSLLRGKLENGGE
jgi:paraquat-inducible protein B